MGISSDNEMNRQRHYVWGGITASHHIPHTRERERERERYRERERDIERERERER